VTVPGQPVGPVPLVLVHGGRFAASCWDRLIPLLEPPVVAVDLPGRGSRAAVDLRSVGIAECVRAVVEDVGEWRDMVVVGHSLAGVTLPSLASALAGRIARMVFVSAAVPQQGQSVIDTIRPELRETVTSMLDDGVYHPVGPEAAAYLCNDMDDEATQFTMQCQVDETFRLLTEPVDLRAMPGVPTTYIRLTDDATLLPSTQAASIAALGSPDVVDLAAGHMAMISRPAELARILEDLRNQG
jgi:pimeloyl-ACP methyl ester carboxylesterase